MNCERCTDWELANDRAPKAATRSAYGMSVCESCFQEAVRIAGLNHSALEEEQRQDAIRSDIEKDWMADSGEFGPRLGK